jgi:hypothetical protein
VKPQIPPIDADNFYLRHLRNLRKKLMAKAVELKLKEGDAAPKFSVAAGGGSRKRRRRRKPV